MITIFGTWLAVFLTLAIFSFLYKDNPFYKIAEHIYVGSSAAYMVLLVFTTDVKPLLIDNFVIDGKFNWILIIPSFFSLLMLLRFIPPVAWLSRWAIAFTIGIGAGIGFTLSLHGYILPQLQSSMIPFDSINNIVIIIGVITTLIYFYFSREHKGVLGPISRVGRIFIMIAFGASFGYTVMARVSLLIGRFYFLLKAFGF